MDWEKYARNANERFVNTFLLFAEKRKEGTTANYDVLERDINAIFEAMQQAYEAEEWQVVQRFAWAVCKPMNGVLFVRGFWIEQCLGLEWALQASASLDEMQTLARFAGNYITVLINLGDWSSAKQSAKKLISFFDDFNDHDSVARVHHQLGIIEHKLGNYREGQAYYHLALNTWYKLEDNINIAKSLHHLGWIAHEQGAYDQAQRFYEQSLKLKEKANSPLVASTLHHLGWLAHDRGDYDEANTLYQQSYQISKEQQNKPNLATTMHQLGRLNQDIGNYRLAKELYQDVLDMYEDLGGQSEVAGVLGQLGRLAIEQEEWVEAKQLYRQCLQIHESLDNHRDVAISYLQLGTIALHERDFSAAQELYERSLAGIVAIDNQAEIGKVYHQLGRLAQVNGNFEEAIQWYLQSAELSKELGQQSGMATSFNQLGVLNFELGEYNKAKKFFELALGNLNQSDNHQSPDIAFTQYYMGEIAMTGKLYHEAQTWYESSLQLMKRLENSEGIITLYGKLANVALLLNDSKKAEELYFEVIANCQAENNLIDESLAAHNLALLYEKQGQLDKAILLMERVVAIDTELELCDRDKDQNFLNRLYFQRKYRRLGSILRRLVYGWKS